MSLFKTKTSGAIRRLVVFPYAGGGAADFRRWRLPEEVELLPAMLPAREGKLSQRPYRKLNYLVDDLVNDLPTDLPFTIYGHSLGAWVGFELTHALRDAGKRMPDKLVVGARQAPQHENGLPPLGRLPREAFIAGMIERYDAIPAVLLERPELLDTFLPALRSDVTLFEDYRYTERPPLDVELHVFHASDDPTVNPEHAEDWREQTTGAFHFHAVSGGHFFHRTQSEKLLEVLI